MGMLSAPAWLLVALLILLVLILIGPERTYQRAVGLLQAFRGTGPDGQESLGGSGDPVPPRGRELRNGTPSDGE